MKVRLLLLNGLLGLALLTGCADDKADVSKERLKAMSGGVEQKPVFAVKGVVKVDGSPAEGVNVLLYRPKDSGEAYLECRTDHEGKFCFTTVESCDGVEAGSYLVAFTHIPKPGRNGKGVDLLKGKYRNPRKNRMELTVKEGAPQESVNYELSTK